MKRLPLPLDTPTFDELRGGFERLDEDTEPRWGKMKGAEMTRHCRRFIELYLGRIPVSFPIRMLARLLGPFFIARVMAKPPTETPKNLSTLPAIKSKQSEVLDLNEERRLLFEAFDEVAQLSGQRPHVLYGSMHADDVHALVRHHSAHHANQFGLLSPERESPPATLPEETRPNSR